MELRPRELPLKNSVIHKSGQALLFFCQDIIARAQMFLSRVESPNRGYELFDTAGAVPEV